MIKATTRTQSVTRFQPQFKRHAARNLGAGLNDVEGISTQGCTMQCDTTCMGCCFTEQTCGTNPGCSSS